MGLRSLAQWANDLKPIPECLPGKTLVPPFPTFNPAFTLVIAVFTLGDVPT
ncbi:MAG TPA: hypothetical protein VNL16_19525 [Chloroflexota bacterium]|nr:hypothetical protein [Chloroflexota bacterium]